MTDATATGPNAIHKAIAEVLKAAGPTGLTLGEIRKELGLGPNEQQQLDRRKRDLKRWYEIEKVRIGSSYRYVFVRERDIPLLDATVSAKVRAEILHQARGRCSMCGRTIERHGITLVVDHKIPQDWGGTQDRDNLWAICEECNGGKKAHFASQDHELMKGVMLRPSVHERIAATLKANIHKPVAAELLEFVANADDWQKRTRELRYLGWKIDVTTRKNAGGRVKSFYRLDEVGSWPTDMTKEIRKFEKDRAARNRQRKNPQDSLI